MRCIHCEKPIRPNQKRFVYPQSKVEAHYSCVSQPSAAETDELLLTDRRSPTRRVYTTDTGRFQTKKPNLSNGPASA